MKTIRKYGQAFLSGTAFCMLFFASALPCAAQDAADTDSDAKPVFTVGGKMETLHGFRWNSDKENVEYGASRSISDVKGEVSAGSSYAVISAAAEYNYRNPARTGFRLNEAYYRYSDNIWDISVGRQIISWGQADGFKLTDVLSARDTSEFIAFSGEDARLASDSIRLRFFHDLFTFEAVAVPFFTPNKLPRFGFENGAKDGLYYIDTPDFYNMPHGRIPITYTKTESTKPKMFTDTEAAARFSFFLPGIDFSVSGFYGWDKNPRFVKSGYVKKGLFNPASPPGPPNPYVPKELHTNLNEEYSRIAMAGIDAAIPAGDVTIRLETAWIGGRYFEPKNQMPALNGAQLLDGTSGADVPLTFDPAVRKHQLLALAGIDWIKDSWTLSAQYFEDLILDHKDDIERSMHRGFASLNISKTFLRDTLKFSASGVVDVNYGSTSSTCSAAYALTDNIRFSLGGDVYTKGYEGKGDFAALHKISALWLKGTFTW
ncbi:hypothetical protein HMPREF9194_02179 [Treponema maltophilum ATCC 51939]|uniref:Uncharacterized protein n=1 Tax=Treponema maltophilum ATCC 51939 TaxID=1125699 RepID=S3L4U1_TREMA|nr:hypothetical protein [Treponema maltophilum]EPF31824.1 hypothetical protein HMPREF9194_02179 [Treponema maltophilum ATCC 51939]